jgi:hypothetical protein
MFVCGEIIIYMNHNGLSVFEEHHCVEAIFFVVKTRRMEYSLYEIATCVSDYTEC